MSAHKTNLGRVHSLVSYAVSHGYLKKLPCEVCGSEKSEGHHDDYSKPLEVRWVCKKHHAEIHKQKDKVFRVCPVCGYEKYTGRRHFVGGKMKWPNVWCSQDAPHDPMARAVLQK